jgi:dTDP-4-amino-4,6-dideoxygalactose transaminase
MEGIQGAILRIKLRRLEAWTEARRRHAAAYDRLLQDAGVELPQALPDRRHVFHLYVVRSLRRDALQRYLGEHEVQTGIHYPIPVHLLPAYADLGYVAGDFPITERVASEILSLPMYPELRPEEQARVAELVKEFAAL